MREIEVLSHAYTKAGEWGYLNHHPFKNEMRFVNPKPRSRYIEDWEVAECLSLSSKRSKGSALAIAAYIRLKLVTGMARGDLLRLTVSDLQIDGIHIQRHKTRGSSGKRTIYEWTPELREVVDQAKSARPALASFLFCNPIGESYLDESTGEAHGWDSMWQRFMERVLAETKVMERFTEHNLRAKCASVCDTIEHARALVSHTDSRTTQAVHRRKPERVKPLER